MKAVLTFVVCLLTATLSAGAPPQVDRVKEAKDSELIVAGSVVSVDSRFAFNTHGDHVIVSDLLVDVTETMKGAHVPLVTVTVEGGEAGGLTLRVSDMPVLERGDRAVFFLDRTPNGEHVPHGRGLGILKFDAVNRIDQTNLTLEDVRRLVQATQK